MKNLSLAIGFMVAVAACARTQALDVRQGSDVTLQKQDGVQLEGRLVEVSADKVVIEKRDGGRTTVPRAEVKSLRETNETGGTARGEHGAVQTPEYREVTIPAGTVLPVELRSSVGSDTSHVEDAVRASLRRAVTIHDVEVLPAGTALSGHVTRATRSARVKGRASVAFRFTAIDPPGPEGRVDISSSTITRVAPATKKHDAAKIGGGAVGGAIIGGILGGGGGAAKGAVIGGGAGTALVMSTRGKEIRLGEGTPLTVRLTAPLTVRVREH